MKKTFQIRITPHFQQHVTTASRQYNQSICSTIPTTFLFNNDPAGYESVKFSSKAVKKQWKKRGNNRYKYLSNITQHFQQHVTTWRHCHHDNLLKLLGCHALIKINIFWHGRSWQYWRIASLVLWTQIRRPKFRKPIATSFFLRFCFFYYLPFLPNHLEKKRTKKNWTLKYWSKREFNSDVEIISITTVDSGKERKKR